MSVLWIIVFVFHFDSVILFFSDGTLHVFLARSQNLESIKRAINLFNFIILTSLKRSFVLKRDVLEKVSRWWFFHEGIHEIFDFLYRNLFFDSFGLLNRGLSGCIFVVSLYNFVFMGLLFKRVGEIHGGRSIILY